ncbi:hypothetical protein LCGC14_2300010 [marine sediment metagenome]|uniref:Uncharacterized protein n=1 Tax=marine sediment metagenome TaxID=412755 RepID=A0A0F9DB99_9ZZZZ
MNSVELQNPILKDLVTHADDRGLLTECCRVDWEEVVTDIRQVYIVRNHSKGTIRAFHCHNELIDYFNIVQGAAKFILFHHDKMKEMYNEWYRKQGNDIGEAVLYPSHEYARKEFVKEFSETEWYQEYTLTDKQMQMLYIPPRWMHGWMSLEDGTMLLSNASDVFNPDKIDCKRIEWNLLGENIWPIKFK